MSVERLQRALGRIETLVEDDEALASWRFDPIEGEFLDELEALVAPLRFAEEHMWMARNGGYLPGFLSWADGMRWGLDEDASRPQSLPLPVPHDDAEWFEYGRALEPTARLVVPLVSKPMTTGPVAFTDGFLQMDIRFPSLATLLEVFGFHLEEAAQVDPELYRQYLIPDLGFCDVWWHPVDDAASYPTPIQQVWTRSGEREGQLPEVGGGHPCWPAGTADRLFAPWVGPQGWIPPEFDD